MADFTTWAALKTAVLNDMSNGSVLTKSYGIEGRSRSFQTLAEVKDFLTFCDMHTASASEGSRYTHVQFERPKGGI